MLIFSGSFGGQLSHSMEDPGSLGKTFWLFYEKQATNQAILFMVMSFCNVTRQHVDYVHNVIFDIVASKVYSHIASTAPCTEYSSMNMHLQTHTQTQCYA